LHLMANKDSILFKMNLPTIETPDQRLLHPSFTKSYFQKERHGINDCWLRTIISSIGFNLIASPSDYSKIQAKFRKVEELENRLQIAEDGGFSVDRPFPIAVRITDRSYFELLQLKMIGIWDNQDITNFHEGKKLISTQLATMRATNYAIVTQHYDQELNPPIYAHASCMKLDFTDQLWYDYDSNYDERGLLTDRDIIERRFDCAASAKVYAWEIVHSSKNPDSKYKKIISFNDMLQTVGLPKYKVMPQSPAGPRVNATLD
jgi:hypothetical protein